MPLYALSRANFAFLELPRPISASVGPFKANVRLFRKEKLTLFNQSYICIPLRTQIPNIGFKKKNNFGKKQRPLTLMASETPPPPPPFMTESILKFHFDYWSPSFSATDFTTCTALKKFSIFIDQHRRQNYRSTYRIVQRMSDRSKHLDQKQSSRLSIKS